MDSFIEGFREYLPPDSTAIRRVITQGLVVLDANVLLDAYRYAIGARTELLNALERVGDRLWIPHQVALEFHRNRANVIEAHGDSYREIQKAAHEFRDAYGKALGDRIREFSNRVALVDNDRLSLTKFIEEGVDGLLKKLSELQQLHGVSSRFIFADPVLDRLRLILADKVGPSMSADDEAAARSEAVRRIDQKIPPGFMDKDKEDPCGDYLVWHQTLEHAKTSSVPLVFVTRDTKEDWYLRVKGKTVAALPQLVREARAVAGVEFVAMTTRTFLIHAQRYLETEVSRSTLDQAEAIRKTSRSTAARVAVEMMPDEGVRLLPLVSAEIARLKDALEAADSRTLAVAHLPVDEAGEEYRLARSQFTNANFHLGRLERAERVLQRAVSGRSVLLDHAMMKEIERVERNEALRRIIPAASDGV